MPTNPQTPPPAYFLSLSLENVRSFGEKQTISFARPDGRPAQWTIILGDNGVGKTTVLKALAALRPIKSLDYDIDPSFNPAYNESRDIWVPIRSGKQSNEADNLKILGIPKQIQNHPDLKVIALDSQIRIGKILSDEFKISHCSLVLPFYQGQSLGRQWHTISSELETLICYGYGAGRTVGNSTLSETPITTDTCASLFDDRADLLNPEEWFLQMEYSSLKKDKQAGKALEQVRQVLLQVLPDITDIRISSKDHQQFLELESPYGWVRLREMSLGYQTLVVWLTDFASKLFLRYPDSPNPLEMPAIVLIDEIDLHLHPSWQRKLLGFLSGIFTNTQFIATAHSPLVVQAAGDEGANVVLLQREGDQTIVRQNPEDVRGWRIDQILTSAFFNLDTAQSLETEKKLARQATLLNKPKLTAKERHELDALTLELEGVPMGSTDAEREEAEILRQLTARLNQSATDK